MFRAAVSRSFRPALHSSAGESYQNHSTTRRTVLLRSDFIGLCSASTLHRAASQHSAVLVAGLTRTRQRQGIRPRLSRSKSTHPSIKSDGNQPNSPSEDSGAQQTTPGEPTSRPEPSQTQPPGTRPAFSTARPPPRQHSAPRLIRYPPPEAEGVEPPAPPPTAQPAALYTYSRGPASRLFSYRNAAAAASASTRRRAHPFARSSLTYDWSVGDAASAISSSYEPVRQGTQASLSIQSESELQADSQQRAQQDTMSGTATGSNAQDGKAAARRRAKDGAATANGHHDGHAGHTHSLLGGHSHSHSHGAGAEASAEEADKLLAALKGKGDRGSNITVVGLAANLILCGAKGVAGVFLHSASLLADAAHSLSDTFSDLVTLFCWKMSQKPASLSHPMGYGKFETMGGLGVSIVLVAGAFAIGMHSYGLLLEVLQPHLQQMPAGFQAISSLTGDIARAAGGMLHDHSHSPAQPMATGDAAGAILEAAGGVKPGSNVASGHAEGQGLLDPNAMWFALISIIVKEWLYRATLKIAREENSSVLEANAIHHRSDSLSSGVTFLAIGGSYLGFPVLDPLGGLLVAGLIGKQGAELLIGALNDLSDRGVQPEVLDDFENVLRDIMKEPPAAGQATSEGARLLGWKNLRAVRSGVSTFVDLTLLLAADTPLKTAQVVEERVRQAIADAHKGVKEVRVRLEPYQQ